MPSNDAEPSGDLDAQVNAARKWTEEHQAWRIGGSLFGCYDFLRIVRRELPAPPGPEGNGLFARDIFLAKLDHHDDVLKKRFKPTYIESMALECDAWAKELTDQENPNFWHAEFDLFAPGEWFALQMQYLRPFILDARDIARNVWVKDQGKLETDTSIRVTKEYICRPLLADRAHRIAERIDGLRRVLPTWGVGKFSSDAQQLHQNLRSETEAISLEIEQLCRIDTSILKYSSTQPERTIAQTVSPAKSLNRKGDSKLLDGKTAVSFMTAETYLGVSDRQRQNLMSSGTLEVIGGGSNKKIATASLRKYLPAENPN
jgi:hypothetical protein